MKKIIKKMSTIVSMIVCMGMVLSQSLQVSAMPKEYEEDPVMDLSRENVQEFLDEYFQKKMEEYHVPGAAVAVVKGDEELLSVSYGVEDLETRKPVTTDQTLFPAASVSKLFTATAIMQLYEQGKIDLYKDIKSYIPVQLNMRQMGII